MFVVHLCWTVENEPAKRQRVVGFVQGCKDGHQIAYQEVGEGTRMLRVPSTATDDCDVSVLCLPVEMCADIVVAPH